MLDQLERFSKLVPSFPTCTLPYGHVLLTCCYTEFLKVRWKYPREHMQEPTIHISCWVSYSLLFFLCNLSSILIVRWCLILIINNNLENEKLKYLCEKLELFPQYPCQWKIYLLKEEKLNIIIYSKIWLDYYHRLPRVAHLHHLWVLWFSLVSCCIVDIFLSLTFVIEC